MKITHLIKRIALNDELSIASLMSYVENNINAAKIIKKEFIKFRKNSYVIGITGSAGVGKSTIIDKLIYNFRKMNKTVGVIAIDPTSAISGGAILADRIRMNEHALDKGVFIRSVATRGEFGGISKSTEIFTYILSACKDIVIVETVGAGQLDTKIKKVSDVTILVMTPSSGDEIQVLKAGIIEIADIFVVNKIDSGSNNIVQALKDFINEKYKNNKWIPPVIETSAILNKGIDELVSKIEEYRKLIK
jgi:LAO/AO transport system kinase